MNISKLRLWVIPLFMNNPYTCEVSFLHPKDQMLLFGVNLEDLIVSEAYRKHVAKHAAESISPKPLM